MRILVQIVLIVLVLGGAGYGAKWMIENKPVVEPTPPEVPLPMVTLFAVTPARGELTVRGRGEVAPRERTQLVSEVDGRVISVSSSLRTGGRFDAKQVLVELDPIDLKTAKARADAAVAQAEAALAQEQAQGAVAAAQYQDIGQGEASSLALRRPQLAQAQAQVAAAVAEQSRAQRDVDRAKILAPFAGCVRSESVSDGQLVARGQVLADLFSSDLAEVRVPLVDGDLAYLDLPGYGRFEGGPSATITTMFAGAARSWTGRVLGMEGEVDGTSRMVTLIVGVEDPYGAAAAATGAPLMPGLFVDVALTGRAVEEAILLPRDALRAGSLVFVVDSKGVLRFRKVTLGWRDEQRVQILTGLAAGDGVCLSPLAAPVDGMRVRVVLPDGSVREPEPAPAAEAPGSETPGADAEAAGHSSQPSPNGGSQ